MDEAQLSLSQSILYRIWKKINNYPQHIVDIMFTNSIRTENTVWKTI